MLPVSGRVSRYVLTDCVSPGPISNTPFAPANFPVPPTTRTLIIPFGRFFIMPRNRIVPWPGNVVLPIPS